MVKSSHVLVTSVNPPYPPKKHESSLPCLRLYLRDRKCLKFNSLSFTLQAGPASLVSTVLVTNATLVLRSLSQDQARALTAVLAAGLAVVDAAPFEGDKARREVADPELTKEEMTNGVPDALDNFWDDLTEDSLNSGFASKKSKANRRLNPGKEDNGIPDVVDSRELTEPGRNKFFGGGKDAEPITGNLGRRLTPTEQSNSYPDFIDNAVKGLSERLGWVMRSPKTNRCSAQGPGPLSRFFGRGRLIQ